VHIILFPKGWTEALWKPWITAKHFSPLCNQGLYRE